MDRFRRVVFGLSQKLYVLKIAGNLFNLLVVINCSVNFVLYSSFSSKFRQTFRRLFCRRGARCRCLDAADSDERRWLRDDDDGMEMTCSRGGGGTTAALTGRPSPAGRGARRRGDETVIVVATPGGGRTFITRQRSRDRKELAPKTTIELTSHYGLTTTTTSLTPGGSMSSISDTSTPLVAAGEHQETETRTAHV